MLTSTAFVILIYPLIPINLNIVRRFPSTDQLVPPLRLKMLLTPMLILHSWKIKESFQNKAADETSKTRLVNESHLYIDFIVKLDFIEIAPRGYAFFWYERMHILEVLFLSTKLFLFLWPFKRYPLSSFFFFAFPKIEISLRIEIEIFFICCPITFSKFHWYHYKFLSWNNWKQYIITNLYAHFQLSNQNAYNLFQPYLLLQITLETERLIKA